MPDLGELKAKAGRLALEYHQKYGGCAQCTLAGVQDTLGKINDDLFRAATGLSGGIGLTGSVCGALLGGVVAMSFLKGRDYDDFADSKNIRVISFKMARKLIGRFEEAYGSIICKDIQVKLFGRSFDLANKDEMKNFLEAGGHTNKCPEVCGNAARWVVEILSAEGLIA